MDDEAVDAVADVLDTPTAGDEADDALLAVAVD